MTLPEFGLRGTIYVLQQWNAENLLLRAEGGSPLNWNSKQCTVVPGLLIAKKQLIKRKSKAHHKRHVMHFFFSLSGIVNS